MLATAVCVSVCVSLTAFPHYCTDPDVTWGMVGVPSSCALLHYWVDLQSVHGFRYYDNIHICKLVPLCTANAYSTERETSASACTGCMAGPKLYTHTLLLALFTIVAKV